MGSQRPPSAGTPLPRKRGHGATAGESVISSAAGTRMRGSRTAALRGPSADTPPPLRLRSCVRDRARGSNCRRAAATGEAARRRWRRRRERLPGSWSGGGPAGTSRGGDCRTLERGASPASPRCRDSPWFGYSDGTCSRMSEVSRVLDLGSNRTRPQDLLQLLIVTCEHIIRN